VRRSRARDRIDSVRARFEQGPGAASASVDDATDRLLRAVDRHFALEDATRATADRLVGALDVIPQGIVLADADGEVVFRNRAASGFFAARHSEALVESAIVELIAEAVAGEGGTRTLDLYGPPRRALQLRAVPLEGEEPGQRAGAFLLVEDVSERQRLDAVRRDFVANISHELKTPVGALGLLAETLAGETDPEVVRRLTQRMQREAFRVARTIDDLLQLSRIEAGELPTREPVPVHLVIAEAVDRTRPGAELQGVRLVVEEPSRRLTVLGDRRQLVSAVANLCDNAVKYSDEGGQVVLSTRTDGRFVEIDVADRGIGIPALDLERVFERFYRVDRARSRDTGGTGLGLAIVRHVVQNHEGSVTVASREGEGSTFTLRLPAGPGPVSVPTPHEAVG
jgi:two-component system sensor histidine kinase SenX3